MKTKLTIFNRIFRRILHLLARYIPDRMYLKLKFPLCLGHRLNLDNPKTYNEKLQWLKLYNRKPDYTMMVDKFLVKDFVANIIGKEHIIPTLSVYEDVDSIDFNALPNQFVLKCTHDSGGIVICTDKSNLNIYETQKKLKKALKQNFYYRSREWPYKDVKPRIIAEKYMADEDGELKDYKFFCFNGVPEYMFIASDRFNKKEETKFDFYNMNFDHLPFTNGHPNSKNTIVKPSGFDEMKNFASLLSRDIPHVRVDFYDINGKVYFGEMTFFHWSGFMPFNPEEWDYKFGEKIVLSV